MLLTKKTRNGFPSIRLGFIKSTFLLRIDNCAVLASPFFLLVSTKVSTSNGSVPYLFFQSYLTLRKALPKINEARWGTRTDGRKYFLRILWDKDSPEGEGTFLFLLNLRANQEI